MIDIGAIYLEPPLCYGTVKLVAINLHWILKLVIPTHGVDSLKKQIMKIAISLKFSSQHDVLQVKYDWTFFDIKSKILFLQKNKLLIIQFLTNLIFRICFQIKPGHSYYKYKKIMTKKLEKILKFL